MNILDELCEIFNNKMSNRQLSKKLLNMNSNYIGVMRHTKSNPSKDSLINLYHNLDEYKGMDELKNKIIEYIFKKGK